MSIAKALLPTGRASGCHTNTVKKPLPSGSGFLMLHTFRCKNIELVLPFFVKL